MKLATRMSRLGTETAFEVLVRARALEAQGRDVIHLEVGEPDFDTPANIIEAGCHALKTGWTHYGPSSGQPDRKGRTSAALLPVAAPERAVRLGLDSSSCAGSNACWRGTARPSER